MTEISWKEKKCSECAYSSYVFMSEPDEDIPCSSCISGSSWKATERIDTNRVLAIQKEEKEEDEIYLSLSKALAAILFLYSSVWAWQPEEKRVRKIEEAIAYLENLKKLLTENGD